MSVSAGVASPADGFTCYVCDGAVVGRYYTLASCKTQVSEQKLVEKLVQLVGEQYLVVISEDDIICQSCTTRLNNLDWLEKEMSTVRSVILRFLEKKYELEEGELLLNSKVALPPPPTPPEAISDGLYYYYEGMDLDLTTPGSSKLPETEHKIKTENKNDFYCKFCHASFMYKSNCNRHEKMCTNNNERLIYEFTCSKCQAVFKRKDTLNKHAKICDVDTYIQETDVNTNAANKPLPATRPRKTKTPCLVENCTKTFHHKTALINHLSLAHKDIISLRDKEVRKFSSVEEFEAWKEDEEEKTFSYFTQQTGQNGRCRHYYCQHDGSEKLHSQKRTNRCNNKGRIKCGHFCMAKIKTKQNEDGSVDVEYFPTHSHSLSPIDIVHRTLPKSVSNFINQQIAEGISPSEIFENAQNMFVKKESDNVQNIKVNILTKKLIRERVRRYRKAQRPVAYLGHLAETVEN